MNCGAQKIDGVLRWWERLKSTTNGAFYPLFGDKRRYLVLMGGAGSGKSVFAGRKLIERCVCEPGHRFLVVRKVARTLRESCFRQLVNQALEVYPREVESRSDLYIRFKNGSEILFTGLDDAEKLKSIYGITGIWIEEASELAEEDFNQLDIRLRGETENYKQIILTFNPVSITHWLKGRFFDAPDERVRTHRSTYRDNRFLDADAKKVLEAYRDTDEYYYTVYCLGEWGVTGKSVFPARLVHERLRLGVQPVRVGMFEGAGDDPHQSPAATASPGGSLLECADGCIRIYAEPVPGRHYVIGCDTAGEGSDFSVAQVLDNLTGGQAAVLRGRFDEDVFARQLFCLGRFYNDALVGVETNFSTYPVLELERLNYPRQYVRESMDEFTHKIKNSYGFRTDAKTRPVILSGLIRAVREHPEDFCDRDTLEEMLTFVRNAEGRPEAESGAHDDCVMALAVAEFIRGQQETADLKEPRELARWTSDMWEDFDRADERLRAHLLSIWGQPRPR